MTASDISPQDHAQAIAQATGQATGQATVETDSDNACGLQTPNDPCAIVIFGATGDLTARKVLPALFTLYTAHCLPETFCILGASRTELIDDTFRLRMRRAVEESRGGDLDNAEWEAFASRLHYQPLDVTEAASFAHLAGRLKELEQTHGTRGNRLFYLAVPPTVYESIALHTGAAGMADEDRGNWVRLVVEKPFGHDLESARQLNQAIMRHFDEHQVFRIDHYLAKETVQNIMSLRFANAIFEPLWNRQYIESVHITASESLGVEHRAGYYDHAGVLRDMFQNHMMQLLSLCAMEPPSKYEADRIRDEKTKVYRSLRPFRTDKLDDLLVLGQYSTGVIHGEKVPAYVDEPGVALGSSTPTYARMTVFVDNWRWQGVPFHLESGKRMGSKRTEIAVRFKQVPCSLFRNVLGEHITANTLTLGIHPEESVHLSFQAKRPGARMCLRNVRMRFDFNEGWTGPAMDAYEKVLLDVMLGDHTLFWRQDGVDLCWGFLTPILEECDCPDRVHEPKLYKAGTDGPERTECEARALAEATARR